MSIYDHCKIQLTSFSVRWVLWIGLLTLGLVAPIVSYGQSTFKFADINPSQTTLDPDASSGGRANGLARDPLNSDVLYVASEWGGLYKSIDGGHVWTHLDKHLPTATWDVAVSPIDGRVF